MWSMLIWWAAWGGTVWAQDECPDPAAIADAAKSALLDAEMETAEALMSEAESALGCSGLPEPELLARLWLVEGARLYFLDDTFGAQSAFRSAARLAPSLWFPEFGERLYGVYQQAQSSDALTPAEIRLDAVPEKMQAALNGQPADFPQVVPPGSHLIQIVERDGTARYARMVMLPPDEIIDIEVGPLRPVKPTRRWGMLGISGASLIAAGGMAYLANQQSERIEQADSSAALQRTQRQQSALTVASYGLGGVAVTGGVLFFAC
ncbi:MAG: hypothetical protein AAFV53_23115 [Myxococcota bacterium]